MKRSAKDLSYQALRLDRLHLMKNCVADKNFMKRNYGDCLSLDQIGTIGDAS